MRKTSVTLPLSEAFISRKLRQIICLFTSMEPSTAPRYTHINPYYLVNSVELLHLTGSITEIRI